MIVKNVNVLDVRAELEKVCKDLNLACDILEKDKGKRKYGPRAKKDINKKVR